MCTGTGLAPVATFASGLGGGYGDGFVGTEQVAQFSYKRIPGADPLRGVEMASTGEALPLITAAAVVLPLLQRKQTAALCACRVAAAAAGRPSEPFF